MIIEAGELNQRATITYQTETQNDIGETADEWAEIGTYWAKLSVLKSRNVELAKGFSASVGYELLMRYRPELKVGNRVEIGSQSFDVDGVIHEAAELPTWSQAFVTLVISPIVQGS